MAILTDILKYAVKRPAVTAGSFLLAAIVLLSVQKASAQQNSPIVIKDITGNTVELKQPAERVLLGEGRHLIALSLVHPRPADVIAGWLGDMKRLGGATYDQYLDYFPELDDIPMVGVTSEETFSVEKALSVQPDIAIFSGGGHGPSPSSSETVRQLKAAGIPVVFVDFRQQPFEHTLPSIEIIGKVLGREEQAKAYINFYQSKMDRIAGRLEQQDPKRPKVLMEMHAGAREECCGSPGKGNLGAFIDFAGGQNIGAEIIPGALGTLNLEYIISEDPDVYIGTGSSNTATPGILVGTHVGKDEARQSLQKVIQRPGISTLSAVGHDRIFGLWHNFYNAPINLLAVEAMARWFHPDLFEDVDPEETLREMNDRFLAVPFEGTYWIGAQ